MMKLFNYKKKHKLINDYKTIINEQLNTIKQLNESKYVIDDIY